jgi:hypothetical protein
MLKCIRLLEHYSGFWLTWSIAIHMKASRLWGWSLLHESETSSLPNATDFVFKIIISTLRDYLVWQWNVYLFHLRFECTVEKKIKHQELSGRPGNFCSSWTLRCVENQQIKIQLNLWNRAALILSSTSYIPKFNIPASQAGIQDMVWGLAAKWQIRHCNLLAGAAVSQNRWTTLLMTPHLKRR